MPNSLFFLLKKAPFPFLKVNGLKFYPGVAAIALQRLPLGVKADQRAALVLQLQRRVKSLDTGQVAKEREQHRLCRLGRRRRIPSCLQNHIRTGQHTEYP